MSIDGAPAVAVIGGGPAGLMAAEVLGAAGVAVTVYERMPSVARKLLLAGRGGLNLTHSEERGRFLSRYGPAEATLAPIIDAFPATALRAWADGLGAATFVGSSGRVFPAALKTSPLLRAWLARLERQGVRLLTRHEWLGWDEAGRLEFRLAGGGRQTVLPDATILALGGASWPRLGADGGWVAPLGRAGIAITPLRPANCGFTVAWSELFRSRFAGQPLKRITLSFAGTTVAGEAVVTETGIEGGAVYALSALPARCHRRPWPGHAADRPAAGPGRRRAGTAARPAATRAVAGERAAQGRGSRHRSRSTCCARVLAARCRASPTGWRR